MRLNYFALTLMTPLLATTADGMPRPLQAILYADAGPPARDSLGRTGQDLERIATRRCLGERNLTAQVHCRRTTAPRLAMSASRAPDARPAAPR